jgi:hypothetical protein
MVAAMFILAFLLLCAGGVLLVVFSDRKRSLGRLGPGQSASKVIPFGIPVATFVDPERADQISRSAIHHIGGHEVTALADGTVIGWVGSSLTNIPSRAQYLVSISRADQPDGSIVLGCAGQPRFSSMAFGAGQGSVLAERLVAEVTALASTPAG